MNFKDMMFRDNELRKTFGISFLAHLIILVAFYFTTISVSIDLPEFVEVNFVNAATSTKKPASNQKPKPQIKESVADRAPTKTEETVSMPEKINLPKRRMLEDEPPELQTAEEKEHSPSTAATGITPRRSGTQSDRDVFSPQEQESSKESFQPSEDAGGIDREAMSTPGFQSSSFEIEGKAADRKILFKVLPQFPDGYNKDGVIKFRFKVLANGHVAEIIPTVKNDAVLEQNARSVFTQWQFNPLPRNTSQESVEGIITFRYRLK